MRHLFQGHQGRYVLFGPSESERERGTTFATNEKKKVLNSIVKSQVLLKVVLF